jgi:hypothetical protein
MFLMVTTDPPDVIPHSVPVYKNVSTTLKEDLLYYICFSKPVTILSGD